MGKYRRDRPTIGLLTGWQAYEGALDSFLGHVFRGAQTAARDQECHLLLACGLGSSRGTVNGRPAWPVSMAEADFVPVGPWNTDGLIVVSPLMSEAGAHYFQELMAAGHRVVFAGCGEPGPAVVADNEGGIRQAVAHLVEHGHRRIAFVAGEQWPPEADSGRRLQGYRRALAEHGLPFDVRLVAHGSHSFAGGQSAINRMLSAGAPFTAVVASNDGSAAGAMAALHAAGRLVPQDVAVIGFDDRLEARTYVPSLTTVHHPMFELGYQALLLLLRYIEGLTTEVEVVRIPTWLAIRESCGCLPGLMPGAVAEAGGAQTAAVTSPEPRQAQGDGAAQDYCLDEQAERAMRAVVSASTQRLGGDEVGHLCHRLVAALRSSLEQGDPRIFHVAMQQILQQVGHIDDDVQAWQGAITILRDALPTLLAMQLGALGPRQVDDMLDRARVAIGEVARGQYARHAIHRAQVADRAGQMTARFLAARDEAEVFRVLAENLPGVGIGHAAVCLYEREGEDPVALSVVQAMAGPGSEEPRFRTREFPPEGLYSLHKRLNLALLPLVIQGELAGFVAFDGGNLEPCAEIVRQVAAALRSVWLYREAVEARRLAEEANRLKTRFLSVVSHELRTPLNLIAGLSDILLREGEAAPEGKCQVRREDLERMYVSAQHLDGLIRDVLDLAGSEVGQLKLVCEPLDLGEVLRAVSLIGQQLARDRGLSWKDEIPAGLPQIWGDRTRLRQVALNLVNNAVKFTARGEVGLIVSADEENLRVAVRDTGLGIPADEQEAIFDEFRQSERTAARGYGGLGLGLALCKRLVEMHGGRIGVSSSGVEGEGSTFHFSLPVMAGPAGAPGGRVALDQAPQVVLLAKDVEGAGLLRDHLARQGFEVEIHHVDGTPDWLAWLLAGPPEAVVLDLGLASERGWEVLRLLKENPATQDVPVLFYALARNGGSGSMLKVDYLIKPVAATQLANALHSWGLLEPQGHSGVGIKVLIVDDEPDALEMYARIVEEQWAGYQVLRARSGREALQVIRQERPDLVLLDLMMPELDGFGVLEAMQEDEASRRIPVIVLTGQVLTQEDVSRLNRGVAGVLGKGLFSVEETLAHIEAALAGRRKLGTEAQRMVRKALAYMHAHYAEPISRADVAFHVGVSERHLSRCFRKEMGMTLTTYLHRWRVRQAKALLEAGEKSITEVAMEVGFSTGGYFTRIFRQEVGLPPSAYAQGESGGRGVVGNGQARSP